MADQLSIDSYLVSLSRRIHGRHDREALLDEVEDHLRTTAERHMAAGMSAVDAERTTVRTFGDPELIAEALADANGPPAVPTSFTQSVGRVAMFGAPAWILLAGAFWASNRIESSGQDWEGTPRLLFTVGMASLAAGTAITLLLMVALRARHGGLGITGMIGIVAAGLSVATSLVAWAVPLWTTVLAVACLPVAAALVRRGSAPRAPTLLLGAAWPVALGTMLLLRSQRFGGPSEWPDYPAAQLTGMTVGCVLMTAAVAGLGRWMGSERAVGSVPPMSAIAG